MRSSFFIHRILALLLTLSLTLPSSSLAFELRQPQPEAQKQQTGLESALKKSNSVPAAGLEEEENGPAADLVKEARRLERKKQWEEALKKWEEAIQQDPKNPELLIATASLLIRIQRRKEALEKLDEVVRLNPGDTGILTEAADLLVQMRRYPAALDLIRQVLNSHPQDTRRIHQVRARALSGMRDLLGEDVNRFPESSRTVVNVYITELAYRDLRAEHPHHVGVLVTLLPGDKVIGFIPIREFGMKERIGESIRLLEELKKQSVPISVRVENRGSVELPGRYDFVFHLAQEPFNPAAGLEEEEEAERKERTLQLKELEHWFLEDLQKPLDQRRALTVYVTDVPLRKLRPGDKRRHHVGAMVSLAPDDVPLGFLPLSNAFVSSRSRHWIGQKVELLEQIKENHEPIEVVVDKKGRSYRPGRHLDFVFRLVKPWARMEVILYRHSADRLNEALFLAALKKGISLPAAVRPGSSESDLEATESEILEVLARLLQRTPYFTKSGAPFEVLLKEKTGLEPSQLLLLGKRIKSPQAGDAIALNRMVARLLRGFADLANWRGQTYEGEITLRLEALEGELILELWDNGPGVTESFFFDFFRSLFGLEASEQLGVYGDRLVLRYGGRIEIDTRHREAGAQRLVFDPAHRGFELQAIKPGARSGIGTTVRWAFVLQPGMGGSLAHSAGMEESQAPVQPDPAFQRLQEIIRADKFSAREKRVVNDFFEEASRKTPAESLHRLNLEVLIPRGVCLTISSDGIEFIPIAGYELYKVPGIKIPLPIVYTPELAQRQGFTAPSGVSVISTHNSPEFLKFSADEELRHLVDVYKFGLFHKIKSLDELKRTFRFRSHSKLPVYIGLLPDWYGDLSMPIVEEVRTLLWHLAHPRPYQKQEELDVSFLFRQPEMLQVLNLLNGSMERERQSGRITVQETFPKPSKEGQRLKEHDLAIFWVAARILSFKPQGPYEFSEIRSLANQIWEKEFSSLKDPIRHRARRVYPKTKAEREAQLIQLAQQAAGLEEKVSLGEVLERIRVELPVAGRQEQPLRFIVDTSKGEPEVLRLLQLGVLLEKERGLKIQAAGVATGEQLSAALAELPDETSRLLLESRLFTYVPGDSESYRRAMEKAQKLVPNLLPEAVITEINPLTIGWFLETIEILAVWKLSHELKDQINSYLTAA